VGQLLEILTYNFFAIFVTILNKELSLTLWTTVATQWFERPQIPDVQQVQLTVVETLKYSLGITQRH